MNDKEVIKPLIVSKKTKKNQDTFIKMFRKTAGHITKACEAANINRRTYYLWMQRDPNFSELMDHENESLLDFAEGMLKKKMNEGDTTSIIFFLKTKGKKRGYVERQEIAHKGLTAVNISFDDGGLKKNETD